MNDVSTFMRGKPTWATGGLVAIDLPYRWLRIVFATISLTVIGLGILRKVILHWPATDGMLEALEIINLESENGLPEWWSVTQFLLASLLLALNGMAETNQRWKPRWFILAAVFVFLSIDESAGIHELISKALIPYHFTGFLLFAWVIPYGLASLIIGILYIQFICALPRDIRLRIVLAGAVFLLAAIGVESIQAYCTTNEVWYCAQRAILVEESGEIIAITLFIFALLALLNELLT